MNGLLIADLRIQQIAQHEGHLRDYEVFGARREMATEESVPTGPVIIERHDRSKPVWELLSKAMELAK